MKSLEIIRSQLERIEKLVSQKDMKKTEVSQASVGWHLHHMLLTFNKIYLALNASDPSEYKSSFNLPRAIIFRTGIIPRGRAKSPKSVIPREDFPEEGIMTELKRAKDNIDSITKLDRNANFAHPFFGSLNLKKTLRFLDIHTNHHLKIVDDILDK